MACANCSQRGAILQWLEDCNSAYVAFILACDTVVLYVQSESPCEKSIKASIFRLPRPSLLSKIFNINNFIIYILHIGRCICAKYIYEITIVKSNESRWRFKKPFIVRATTQLE